MKNEEFEAVMKVTSFFSRRMFFFRDFFDNLTFEKLWIEIWYFSQKNHWKIVFKMALNHFCKVSNSSKKMSWKIFQKSESFGENYFLVPFYNFRTNSWMRLTCVWYLLWVRIRVTLLWKDPSTRLHVHAGQFSLEFPVVSDFLLVRLFLVLIL